MRRMKMMNRRGGRVRSLLAGAALVLGTTLLAALPVAATPANLASDFGFVGADLGGLPVSTIDAGDTFYTAGESGRGSVDVELTGSTNICLFTAASPVCQADTAGVTGPYSVVLTVEVTAVNAPGLQGPFTLLLSGLLDASYAPSEVSVELDPVLPAGLDTSGIAGLNLAPFVHVQDETFAPGTIYHYIGWTVQLGDTVSFLYNVSSAPGARSVPPFAANAVALTIVPEPGTALLMGLGLAGLAAGNRRLAGTVA